MQFGIMFCFGFMGTTCEFQLVDYGVPRSQVGFWYSIWTAGYLISCALVSKVVDKFSKTRTMLIGTFWMSLAYLLLGPCPLIFPRSIVLVAVGLAFVGLSAGFLYVPTIPHILEVLKYVYGFDVDDRVHDSMAAITNISLCLGEITGPIMSSLLYYEIGYAYTTFVASLMFFSYGVFYALVSSPKNYGIVENVTLLTIKDEPLESIKTP
jgi:MFS family permease